MIAEPPEAAPGDSVTMTVYYADPGNSGTRIVDSRFGTCHNEDPNEDCVPNLETILSDHAAVTTRIDDILTDTYRYVVPNNIFDGASLIEQFYGVYADVFVHANNSIRTIDALKRVVVTPAKVQPKNKNPRLLGFDILYQDIKIGDETFLPALNRATAYTLKPRYDASSLEAYQIIDYNQQVHILKEEPSFIWSCSEHCTLDRNTSYNNETITLTPPLTENTDNALTVHVVMRDGRGGEAFVAARVVLLPEVKVSATQ